MKELDIIHQALQSAPKEALEALNKIIPIVEAAIAYTQEDGCCGTDCDLKNAVLDAGLETPTYYQPELEDDEWGVLLNSFQVYRSKERAQKDFPGRIILEYHGDEIKEPTYVD